MKDPLKAAFARFLDAASPYLGELVVAGGWASRLHRLSAHANPPDFAPLLTNDVDAALRTTLSVDAEPLDRRLVACGFEEKLSSDFKPPVTRYELSVPAGFEVEFLADQPGGYRRRDGTGDATVEIAGVTAQKLHYVRLLLVAPWIVEVRSSDGYPMDTPVRSVRVPNPASYVVQKLLARKYRSDEKRVKDVLYVHDMLELFGDVEDLLSREWDTLRMHLLPKWLERCRASATQIGSHSHPDVVACAQLAKSVGRRSSAEGVASVIRAGLAFLRDQGGSIR